MIAEVPWFNVSKDERENDRKVMTAFYAIPRGTKVILFLGGRQMIPIELLQHVARDYIADLRFEFQGEPAVTARAIETIREILAATGRA